MSKICTNCLTEKTEEEFNFKNKEKGTRSTVCKQCHCKYRREHYLANQQYYQRKARKWIKANPTKAEDQRLKKFGITSAKYQEMLTTQNHACAVCSTPPARKKRLAVDHCHSSGKVRGLLCSSCNLAIGLLQDDPVRMQAALDYLQKFRLVA